MAKNGSLMKTTELLMYSTVQIQTTRVDGLSFGTGFFVELRSSNGETTLVLVTNKHVIDRATKLRIVVSLEVDGINGMTPTKRMQTIDMMGQKWMPHYDAQVDLCCLDVSEIRKTVEKKDGVMWFVSAFKREQIILDNECELAPADEVFMVGYPDAIRDKINNQPIFRRGVFATHPKLDFEGKPCVLVDMPVFGGSSGSPLIVLERGLLLENDGLAFVDYDNANVKLYGIAFGTYTHIVQGGVTEVSVTADQIATVGMPNNLGLVVKANKILDFENFL